MNAPPEFDEIGYWSEVKLEILKEYASAYSKILAAQKNPDLGHVYIDAFAGAGMHLTRLKRNFILGSPLNALCVQPPFREYHLIDILPGRVESLRKFIGPRQDVFIHQGDCNEILLKRVFPRVQYKDYRRGLCILDPYGLDLDWQVIFTAGRMKTIDIFLNFPVADMNRNVLWRDPQAVDATQKSRLNRYWGDDSWEKVAYRTDTTLFGEPEKQSNEVIAEAFRKRLGKTAGFARVPRPIPMRNTRGAIVIFSLHHKKIRRNISFWIFLENTKSAGEFDGDRIVYRMDGRDVEPGEGLHEDQPRMQALLCGDVRGTISRREGASLRAGI
jgi:three-Cys-motif partner protein